MPHVKNHIENFKLLIVGAKDFEKDAIVKLTNKFYVIRNSIKNNDISIFELYIVIPEVEIEEITAKIIDDIESLGETKKYRDSIDKKIIIIKCKSS